MAEKHEYLSDFNMNTPHDIAKTMAVYIVDLQKEYNYLVVLRFF